MRGFFLALAVAGVVSCGGPSSPTRAPDVCVPDMKSLLARHASAPSAAGEAARVHTDVFVDATRFRLVESRGKVSQERGIDAAGPWELRIDGVLHRLEPREAVGLRVEEWLLRRAYAKTPAWSAQCKTADDGRALVVARPSPARPDLGDPELTFDAKTAALDSVTYTGPTSARVTRVPGPLLSAPSAPCAGCLDAPASRVAVKWPESGRVSVRASMSMPAVVRVGMYVLVGGRSVYASLDSGADLTLVDRDKAAAGAVRDTQSEELQSLTTGIPGQLGTIERIGIGDLALERVPAMVIPIGESESSDLFLGKTLFELAAVRIDFATRTLTFAREAEGLVQGAAVAQRLSSVDGRLVIEGTLDGHTGLFEIDTAGATELVLYRSWAKANGLSGGSGASEAELFTVQHIVTGPIDTSGPGILGVDPPPRDAGLAGILGLQRLARCKAAVLDVRTRRLWLEPPCDR